jgi:hypothetical protein
LAFSGDELTAITRAPRPWAIWIAMLPTPDEAAATTTVSPAMSLPREPSIS